MPNGAVMIVTMNGPLSGLASHLSSRFQSPLQHSSCRRTPNQYIIKLNNTEAGFCWDHTFREYFSLSLCTRLDILTHRGPPSPRGHLQMAKPDGNSLNPETY